MQSFFSRRWQAFVLALVVLLAAGLRLQGVGFGLPALLDPDEPIFVLGSLKLLASHSLNPGWFGHPGTTTIYAQALIDIGTFQIGRLRGDFPDQAAFVDAVYRDPGIVFLPGRLFIVLCSIGCVALVYMIGRRLGDGRTGLVAAGVLALNPVHIQWSQIIRTDIQASMFMLACVLFALRIARDGRAIDYLGAAAMTGLAIASKWPAAVAECAIIAAAVVHAARQPSAARRQALLLAGAMAATIVATVLASPYLLLDYRTVIADVVGEAQQRHLGATGGSFADNLGWYLSGPLQRGFGLPALVASAVGLIAALRASPGRALVVAVPAVIFMLLIATQSLVWVRWVVPVIPFVAIFAGVGAMSVIDAGQRALGSRAALIGAAGLFGVMAAPMAVAARDFAIERSNDTRSIASRWVIAHVPRNTSVAVEHFAFDLAQAGYPIVFPVGRQGCRDVKTMVSERTDYKKVGAMRGTLPLVDFGIVDQQQLATCRARIIILTDYDRYKAEGSAYPGALAAYAALVSGSEQIAVLRPVSGRTGGPVTRIYRFADSNAQR